MKVKVVVEDETLVLVWSKTHPVIVKLRTSDGTIEQKHRCPASLELLIHSDGKIAVQYQGRKALEAIVSEQHGEEAILLNTTSATPEVSLFYQHQDLAMWITKDSELFVLGSNEENEKAMSPIPVSLPDHSSFNPHFIRAREGDSYKKEPDIVMFACLEDQLICLGIDLKTKTSKRLLQIKKHYDGVEVSKNAARVYAYSAGIIDVFALDTENHDEKRERMKAKLFVTLEAHTKPVTKVLPAEVGQ